MASHAKESLTVDATMAKEPEIGRWLWALHDCRQNTLREVEHVTPAMLNWLSPDKESTLGTLLYHIADIEADWLYVEVLEESLPSGVAALFPHQTRDDQGHLTQIGDSSLEEHLSRLESVRGLLLDAYRQMELADFRRVRSFTHYDVTPEWVLHHLMQHEAEHRGQIGTLRAQAERYLSMGEK